MPLYSYFSSVFDQFGSVCGHFISLCGCFASLTSHWGHFRSLYRFFVSFCLFCIYSWLFLISFFGCFAPRIFWWWKPGALWPFGPPGLCPVFPFSDPSMYKVPWVLCSYVFTCGREFWLYHASVQGTRHCSTCSCLALRCYVDQQLAASVQQEI